MNNFYAGALAGTGFHYFLCATMNAGWVGVDLFFILSGFLITGILLDTKEDPAYFTNFYARRILRIFPLYYAFLITCLFILPAISPTAFHFFYSLPTMDGCSLLCFFYNFRVAYTHAALPDLHVFWSLAVEEHFYLLWPMLVLWLGRRGLLRLCIVIMAFSLLCRLFLIRQGFWVQTAYLITPCRLDGLAAGAFIAIARRDSQKWNLLTRLAPYALATSALILIAIIFRQGHLTDNIDARFNSHPGLGDSNLTVGPGLTALAIFFASSLVAILNRSDAGRAGPLTFLALRKIGEVSYGMYVFHLVIMHGIHTALNHAMPSINAERYDVPAKLLLFIATVGATYIAAWLSFHLFEQRFNSLKRFFRSGQPQPS